MERCVPVIDWRVITPEGDLEEIVGVITDDQALHFGVKSGRWRRAGARIRTRGQAELAEDGDLRRQGGSEVQHELAFLKAAVLVQHRLRSESAVRPVQITCREVDVRESRNFEEWIARQGLLGGSSRRGNSIMIVQSRGRRRLCRERRRRWNWSRRLRDGRSSTLGLLELRYALL